MVIGGYEGRPLSSIEAYDTRRKFMEPKFPNLPYPSILPAICQTNFNTLYVFGLCQSGYIQMYN